MAKEADQKRKDDFVDIDVSEDTKNSDRMAARSGRPVKKVAKTADDPMAESRSTEDIYSGHYVRDTSDHGVYTGGTKNDRMMSSTATSEERVSRARRRRKQRRHRVVIAVVVIVLLVVIAAAAVVLYQSGLLPFAGSAEEETEPAETEPPEEETEPAEEEEDEILEVAWTKDGSEEVTQLVTAYYTALVAGDTQTLTETLDEAVETPVLSEYVEDYEDLVTYVAEGLNEGEYAVYITFSTKLAGIDTTAPGMVPAYARPDEEGNLRLLTWDGRGLYDDEVTSYMNKVSGSTTIQELNEEIEEAYEKAQEEDDVLKSFIAALSGTGVTSGEESTAAENESEAESTEAQEAGAETVAFQDADDIQYTTGTDVRFRTSPTTEGEDYVTLALGTKVHVIGISDEWCKVTLMDGSNRNGYIYREYLSPYEPETQSDEEE